ncbi:MAG: MFS transporter [Prevotella sp.]
MDTQNTPVHIMLWHKAFWLLAFAELLLAMSVYLFIPSLSDVLSRQPFNQTQGALCLMLFVVGLYLPGGFLYAFIQRYRRNAVCLCGLIVFFALQMCFIFLSRFFRSEMLYGFCILLGSSYGLAQMVLLSTLVIDKSESFQRTEANYIVSWFGRLALSIGPLAGLLTRHFWGFDKIYWLSAFLSLGSFLLVASVHFPFKTPEDIIHFLSLDRFFLRRGTPLFFSLMLFASCAGLMLGLGSSLHFFAFLMAGFLLAILAEKYVFADAELKSEVITGCILMLASALLQLTRDEVLARDFSSLMLGTGIGIIASRFLLFFIKLSRHCERGTSQSTFFLGWESGLTIGVAVSYLLSHSSNIYLLTIALLVLGLILYNYVIHPWYLHNKNR